MRSVISFGILIIMAINLGYNFLKSAEKQNFEKSVRADLKDAMSKFPATSINDLQFKDADGKNIITTVMRTPFVFSKEQVREIEKSLPVQEGYENELHIRSVITTETTKRRRHQIGNKNTASTRYFAELKF